MSDNIEKAKRDAGMLYNAGSDPQLLAEVKRAKGLCHRYNQLEPMWCSERFKEIYGDSSELVIVDGDVLREYVCLYGKNKLTMKRIIFFVLASFLSLSCEKISTQDKIAGSWTEQYDPTVFAMDGSVTYTFDGNNSYHLHVYDALSDESRDYNGHYAIDNGTITINPAMSDYSNVTYKIVKLTSKEMAWQKKGTTYSQGSWGNDYRHFVRNR